MLLNFLTKLPDRYLLVVGFFSVMAFYAFFPVDAVLQLMINFAVAIIALSQKKPDSPTTTPAAIAADTINTGDVLPTDDKTKGE